MNTAMHENTPKKKIYIHVFFFFLAYTKCTLTTHTHSHTQRFAVSQASDQKEIATCFGSPDGKGMKLKQVLNSM